MKNFSICSPQLSLSPSSSLGGEIYDVNILKRLDQLGIKLKIIIPWGLKYLRLKNAQFKYVPIRKIPAHLYNLFWIPYINKFLKEGDIDLLRAHSSYFVAPGELVFKKIIKNNLKIIVTQHHLEPDIWGKFVHRKILPKVDGIISVASDVKNKLIQRGVDADKIEVIFNGIDQKKFFPKPKSQKLLDSLQLNDEKETIFMYLGQVIHRKRIDIIIKAFNKLRKTQKNVKLLIVGSGKEVNNLKTLINTLNLGNSIKFTGYVAQELLNDYYNLCDVFIFHSILDALPFSVLEAMACGKPVIGSNVGDVKNEISHKENGYLIEPLDVDALLKSMELYHLNKEKIRSDGKNSLKRINKYFTWDICVRKTLKFYKRFL